MAMEQRGSGLMVFCRELIKGLSGVFGAHARKRFLMFIKARRVRVFAFELSWPSTGESKWTTLSGENIMVREVPSNAE